jgi:hypothetical protein
VGSSSASSTSASGISGNSSIGTVDRRHSFAVELPQQARSAADSAASRQRSFGGFVVSSGRSFRAFTRNLTCGSFSEEQQDQEDVSMHAPGVRFASDPRLLRVPAAAQQEDSTLSSAAALQQQQQQQHGTGSMALSGFHSQQLDDGGDREGDLAWGYGDSPVDGDSVSSFAPGAAAAAPAAVQEHPLLTTEYKSLMMCASVSACFVTLLAV